MIGGGVRRVKLFNRHAIPNRSIFLWFDDSTKDRREWIHKINLHQK